MPRKSKDTEDNLATIDERVRALELANAKRDERDQRIDKALQHIESILTNGLSTQVHDLTEWMLEQKKSQEKSGDTWRSILFPIARDVALVVIGVLVGLVLLHAPQLGITP